VRLDRILFALAKSLDKEYADMKAVLLELGLARQ
jgi:hypothetical protein